jgi:hypothetical protein
MTESSGDGSFQLNGLAGTATFLYYLNSEYAHDICHDQCIAFVDYVNIFLLNLMY